MGDSPQTRQHRIIASQQPVMDAHWPFSHSRCNVEVKPDPDVIKECVPALLGICPDLNLPSLTHTFTHNLSFSLLSLISPGFCLGGSHSRTNSVPPPDKRQEVMRWAGRGQLPVSCENSNSFSSETERTCRRDESDLAVTAVVDLKDHPCLEAWTWIIFFLFYLLFSLPSSLHY